MEADDFFPPLSKVKISQPDSFMVLKVPISLEQSGWMSLYRQILVSLLHLLGEFVTVGIRPAACWGRTGLPVPLSVLLQPQGRYFSFF